MSPRARIYVRFLGIFALLGIVGLAGSLYVLVQQRAPVLSRDTYDVRLELAAANGLVQGIGQPVNVAGVKVGQVTKVAVEGGHAVVDLQIRRSQLPHVYADATAAVEPITPLADLQIALDPGDAPAPTLRAGATIPLANSTVPVPLSDVLDGLDADTRDFLTGLIASLDQGTRGRAGDLRRLLRSFGPTTAQVGRITRELTARRRDVARLVHNLSVVAGAASRDDRLTDMVRAGNQTLAALAGQERPLQAAIAELPPTLAVTRSTLASLEPFSRELGPSLRAITPGVARLPSAFDDVRAFARVAVPQLRDRIRPFVREAEPVVRGAGPALGDLSAATPGLARSFQVFRYALNEFAYNPPGDDEGMLFWFSWFMHNANSVLSMGDAHGGIGRSAPLIDCGGLQATQQLQGIFDLTGLCPA